VGNSPVTGYDPDGRLAGRVIQIEVTIGVRIGIAIGTVIIGLLPPPADHVYYPPLPLPPKIKPPRAGPQTPPVQYDALNPDHKAKLKECNRQVQLYDNWLFMQEEKSLSDKKFDDDVWTCMKNNYGIGRPPKAPK
jgi:hypothetical protein